MLDHIRVLDLTSELGAFAGRMLAELGAEVLKPGPQGDPVWNAGKTAITIESEGDLRELANGVDIVLHQDDLPFNRPKNLIAVRIETLPDRPATDLTLMARSGLITIGGDPDRPPLKLPGEQAYALAGIQAAIAALTALHARGVSGRGQSVSVSAYRSAVLANYRDPIIWAWTGRVGARTGNLLVRGKSGVRQVWRCRDGYVTWSIIDNPGMMRGMVKLLGEEDAAGPLAAVDWDRTLVADMPRETLEQWEAVVAGFLERHDKGWLNKRSAELGLGLSGIDQPADVLASAQNQARGLWRELADGTRIPGPLFQCSEETTP